MSDAARADHPPEGVSHVAFTRQQARARHRRRPGHRPRQRTAFARAGATVVATDINAAALATLDGEVGITTRILDVLKDEAVAAVVSETGPFDVLFNCAGFVHAGSILEMSDKDLDFAFDLNVRAMIRVIRAVLPAMLEKKDGSIINMASVASSVKGVPNRCAYNRNQGGRRRP